MKRIIRKLFKTVAPKIFNDGLERCNALGKKLVKKKETDRFLDVGCAYGDLTLEFTKLIKCKSVYGVEFIEKYQKMAIQRGIHCQRQDLNKRWNFKTDFFDLILSSQNIEHMHNTRLYLEECYRCLKPEGQVLILSENLASWINIFSLILGWEPFSLAGISGASVGNPFHVDMGKNDWLERKNSLLFNEYRQSGISGLAGHIRVLSYQGLKDLMEMTGFKQVEVYTKGYLPFWGIISDLMCFLDKRHGHFLIGTGFK